MLVGRIRLAAVALVLTTLVVGVVAASDVSAQRRLDEAGYEAEVQALRAADPDARMAAVEAIAHGGWPFRREAASHLRRLLRSDPDWRVRASSGRAIGRLGLREALPELVRALRDPQVDVRIVAAATLWRLPDAAAVPGLLELLNDTHPTARQWSARALGVTGDIRATEPLLALLSDTTGAVRLDALRALGRIADPEALPGLLDFVRATRPDEEQFEAVQALAALRGPDKMGALVQLLDVQDTNLRLHIARALGRVGRAAEIPALRTRRVTESDTRVRTRLDEAIIAIQERERQEADP